MDNITRSYLKESLEKLDLKMQIIDGTALCIDLSMNSGFNEERLHNAITGLSHEIKTVADEIEKLANEVSQYKIVD